MRSRYEAYMDGIALSTVNPKILIHDIKPTISSNNITTESVANRHGAFLITHRRAKTSVSISFELREYDIAKRQGAMQEIQKWASGRVLETNDRPGQMLIVSCDKFPYVGSAMHWLEEVEIIFTSYDIPFWMEKTPSVLELSAGTSGSGQLYVPGNAPEAFAEAVVTPSSGTMANCSLTVGNSTITLTGVDATSSAPVRVYYDDRNILHIVKGTTSLLDKRTGADDLKAVCGSKNTMSFTASSSAAVSFSVKGAWL